MTWAQSHIRMTAYQILLVAAGFFLVLFSFCFVFIRLLGFVSCAYKWSCKRPINAHLWKDKEKLSSLFFCLPKMDEEEIDFKVEAEAVIEDIGFTVKSISVSRKLPSSRECVYLNVLTKECKSLCIELSVLGFRVSYVFFFLKALVIHRSSCAIINNELFEIMNIWKCVVCDKVSRKNKTRR